MRVELIDCYLPDDSRWWGSWRNVREPEVAPVFEDRWYSLALYEYDRTGEYRVFVGDEELKLESREFTNSLDGCEVVRIVPFTKCKNLCHN